MVDAFADDLLKAPQTIRIANPTWWLGYARYDDPQYGYQEGRWYVLSPEDAAAWKAGGCTVVQVVPAPAPLPDARP